MPSARASRGHLTSDRPLPDPDATAAVRERIGSVEGLPRLLPAVAAVGGAFEGIYLVGGAVRDVLLGERSPDLDVMVEGDAIALARDLAQRLEGTVRTHERFQTAIVQAGGAGGPLRIDIAGARTESYPRPGALPEVERSNLRHDLARRDFSVNAMATSLRPDDLGATYDLFGGYADLRQSVVRVLHDGSFVEDPTRLLRAVRYETRLAFRMESSTLALARAAIDSGALGEMQSARLRDELLDVLAEPRVAKALERIAELGLDRALHPGADAHAAAALVARAADAMQGALAGARAPLVALACLCRGMAERDIHAWLGRLKVPRDEQQVVAAAVAGGPSIAERLAGPQTPAPSQMHGLLAGRPLEALVMGVAVAEQPDAVAERVGAYVERVRDVRLAITGDDLRQAGVPESPAIGKALAETLALKLDGFVDGRDDELRAALRLLGRQS